MILTQDGIDAWIVKGLDGLCNLLEARSKQHDRVSMDLMNDLKSLIQILTQVTDGTRRRRQGEDVDFTINLAISQMTLMVQHRSLLPDGMRNFEPSLLKNVDVTNSRLKSIYQRFLDLRTNGVPANGKVAS